MPFPVTHAGHTWADGPSLLAAVIADARGEGTGAFSADGPAAWLGDLVDGSALEPELAVGLVAALLQRRDEAGAVAEAARLAVRLGRKDLGDLLLMALDACDTGLLLTSDPRRPTRSIEDALLDAAGQLADLSNDGVRARLLPRLRNAGLVAHECAALARHGTVDEIRTWMPAILLEGVPEGGADALVDALADRDDARDALIDAFLQARPADRAALLDAIAHSDRRAALRNVVTRLVPGRRAEA